LKLEVAGHTDNVGQAASNLALSQRRAQSVAGFLAARGVAKDRLTAKGYGDTKAIADNATAAGRLSNRRVEFVAQ
jgi:outer membrane protein OmpA-like peptidoglycan-associated protein